ncbi:MAG: hypothetical protein ACYS5V_17240, partial [Planctomycetota bacterium]
MVEGIRSSIPAQPTPAEIALWAGDALCDLVEALYRNGDDDEALAQGRRLIDLLGQAMDAAGVEQDNGPLGEAEESLRQGDMGVFGKQVKAVLSLPEVMLMGLPARPAIEEVPAVLRRMQSATFALRREGKHNRAARTAHDVLALAERLRGHAGYCFQRVNALLELTCLAGAGGDDDQAGRLSEQVLAELAQGEKALDAASGEGAPEPAGAADPTLWRGKLGDAYWQAAHVLHLEELITPAQALPL